MKTAVLMLLMLDALVTLSKAAPQSQAFGGRECNQPNTEFRRCEISTRATCLVPEPNSDEYASHCEDGCFCTPGYYYNAHHQCVLLEECETDAGLQAEPDEDVSAE